jgi:tripartite-type tricarboxylate transporter receptor subunit TctC
MLRSLFHARRTLLVAAALALAAPLAGAQSFPNRPIRLLVGYAAGGGMDAAARLVGQRLTTLLGQQVLVENRSGASGMIAAEFVAKAPADGYTLLMGESGMLITSQLQPRAGFDPVKAFTPVAGAFVAPLMIIANNNLPVHGPKDLIALLQAHPGKYSYATSGVGTVHHLGFETLKQRAHAFVVHIPYRGASQIIPDVVSGQVPIGVVSAAAGLAQARGGKVRAIALMNTGKLAGAEDIPSMAQALPGFDVAPHLMVLAPAGTPQPVVDRLAGAMRTVMANPELTQAAAAQGLVPAYAPPAAVATLMKQEFADAGRTITAQKISAN